MPQQCTNSATNPTSAEWLTCTQARAGTSPLNPLYTSGGGGGSAGSNAYVYDGAAWIQWQARSLGDNVDTTLKMPGALSLGYYFDGMNWDRVRGGTLTDNLTQPTGFPYGANFQMVWDGSKWDRMTQPGGGTTGNAGDAISATQAGVYSLSLGTFYNSTSGKFQRWTGPGAGADAITNSTPSPWMSGWLYGYNGTTWDRLRTGTGAKGTGVLRVNLATDDSAITYLNTLQGTVTTSRMATNPISGQAGVQGAEGAITALTQRVSLATDDDAVGYLSTLQGTVSSARIAINPISGKVGVQAAEGAITDTTQRVSLATDDDAVSHLSNIKTAAEIIDNSIGTPASASPTGVTMAGFHDGTNAVRLAGLSAGADATTNSTPAPWIANFNYGFNGATWDRLYVLGTQADAQATTINGIVTSSFLYGYNGATFDMLRIGASNELQVTDVAVRPGEDAGNDYRKVKVDAINTSTPAKKTTAVDSAGTDIVIASTQVIGYTNFCAYVKNVGGGNGAAFNNLQFQSSPDDTSWTGDLGWTDGDAAASGSTFVYCVTGNGYNYVRAVASTAASDTTADGWITLNKG